MSGFKVLLVHCSDACAQVGGFNQFSIHVCLHHTYVQSPLRRSVCVCARSLAEALESINQSQSKRGLPLFGSLLTAAARPTPASERAKPPWPQHGRATRPTSMLPKCVSLASFCAPHVHASISALSVLLPVLRCTMFNRSQRWDLSLSPDSSSPALDPACERIWHTVCDTLGHKQPQESFTRKARTATTRARGNGTGSDAVPCASESAGHCHASWCKQTEGCRGTPPPTCSVARPKND